MNGHLPTGTPNTVPDPGAWQILKQTVAGGEGILLPLYSGFRLRNEKGMPCNPATVPAAVNEFARANVDGHCIEVDMGSHRFKS